MGKQSNFNYYDITDGWVNKELNINAEECKQLCIRNSSCVFAIHFFRNQFIGSGTEKRKPLVDAPANTCILRNELRVEYGTKKDSACNIYYLTSNHLLLHMH